MAYLAYFWRISGIFYKAQGLITSLPGVGYPIVHGDDSRANRPMATVGLRASAPGI
jgi:hypothetical protein